MSSGLGEWEKGIPCMLHGSQGGKPGGVIILASGGLACPATHFWPPCPVYREPPSQAVGRAQGAVALVYSARFNLSSQG